MKDLTDRYSRQTLFTPIGKEGQAKIRAGRILIVGCGALGTNIANLLCRSGVGFLRIVDRDLIEKSNLPRQVLFEESDAIAGLPKSEAAKAHLDAINSDCEIEAIVRDVNPRSMEPLLDGIDLVLDGTDNFETRYLVNDACVKNELPWVYGGAVGASGASMAFVPGGPCLACVFPEPPEPGQTATCDTAGVVNTAPALIAALQVTEALKVLVGQNVRPTLWHLDLWAGQTASVTVSKREGCTVCGKREFRYLNKTATAWVANLCGRNAVQITPAEPREVDLEAMRVKLSAIGNPEMNGYLLQCSVDGVDLIVFPDGRVIVRGITDEDQAKSIVSRYIGM
jgi:molybdopterin-synthase adenylyltransferase